MSRAEQLIQQQGNVLWGRRGIGVGSVTLRRVPREREQPQVGGRGSGWSPPPCPGSAEGGGTRSGVKAGLGLRLLAFNEHVSSPGAGTRA